MASAFFHVITPRGGDTNITIQLNNIPIIEKVITKETKMKIAYEVLEKMKEQGNIKCFVYTEDSGDDKIPERIIHLV